jgi:uncharacterized damage-inducible protein DinB
MITSDYVRTMASYNRWQNESLYGAADTLTDAQRKEQRGAFFGSIHGTLNHLLWADKMWMSRFAGTPRPKGKRPADSTAECETWDDLKAARGAFDATIIGWAAALEASWLQGELTWFSGAAGREVTKPKWLLVTHMFNHQTHHRGQVHCMLTQCAVKPGATDLPFQRVV